MADAHTVTDPERTAPALTVLIGQPQTDGGWSLEEEPLLAASYPAEPPKEWFRDPKLSGPTMLTIEDSGRVYGHAADWSVPHLGLPGRYAPRSKTSYRYFLSGNTKTADGDIVRTGHLTVGGGHADLQASAADAKSWYDDVSTCFADVACGEDQYGWWVAGALRPDVTPAQLRAARGSSLSGDWRPVREGLEAVAAHAVNTPGFGITQPVQPMAQVASAADGSQYITALVAAGVVQPVVIVTPQSGTSTSEEDTMPEATAVAESTDTPAEPESVTAAAAPSFAKDQVVTLPSTLGPGLVASIDGDRAVVSVEVPLAELADAGPEGRAALSASAREKLMDSRLDDALGEIKALREDMASMVASAAEQRSAAEAKQRGAAALAELLDVPELDAAGN